MRRQVWAVGLISTSVVAAVMGLAPGVAFAAPSTGSSGTGSASGPNIDANNYAQQCPDIMMLAISGATDSKADRNPLDERDRSPIQNWVGNVTVPSGLANSGHPGSVGWQYIPYPSDYGVGLTEVSTYQQSVAAGVASTNNLMNITKTTCGTHTKMVLVGYSVGSDVIERVAQDIGKRPADAFVNASDIAGISLVGDPYRPAGTTSMGDAGPAGGGFMSSDPKDYGVLADKMTWACRPLDIACDAPKNIAVLPLALSVLGQMHFTLINPLQTVVDFVRVMSDVAVRAIVDISTKKDWIDSDATVLDTLLKVSDSSYPVDMSKAAELLTPDKLVGAINWATGPGAGAVQKKLDAEAANFADKNAGLPSLLTEPYLFVGFLQHLYYWNNTPGDNRVWESEKIVSWVTGLADIQRAINAAPVPLPAPAPADPLPAPAPAPVPAPPAAVPGIPGLVIPGLPTVLPAPGTPEPLKSSFESVLTSLGINVPPGLFPPDPNATNPNAP